MTNKPPLAVSRQTLETFLLSSGLHVPEHPEIYEIERAMTKAPVKKGRRFSSWEQGRRFDFHDLDGSVCGDEEFLALVSWLFPLIPDDTAKKKDMIWAYAAAIAFEHESAAVWLIENGLDLKRVILEEGTALGCAASFNRPKIVRLLLEKGCDPNACKPKGHPPLFELLNNLGEPDPRYEWIYENAIETARLLIDSGAKREMTYGKKTIRDVDIAEGSLKQYLQWLDSGKEGVEIGEVMKPGKAKPKRRGP